MKGQVQAWMCFGLSACLVLAACAKRAEPSAAVPGGAGQVASSRTPEATDTDAWVNAIDVLDKRVDEAFDKGDLQSALKHIDEALVLETPPAVNIDDRRTIKQDLYFRSAQAYIEMNQPKLALAQCDTGLLLGKREDIFTVNLLIARAEAQKMLGANVSASDDYLDALRINQKLLDKALAQDDKP